MAAANSPGEGLRLPSEQEALEAATVQALGRLAADSTTEALLIAQAADLAAKLLRQVAG